MPARPIGSGRPRALLAWELGDGFGHVGRLLALAERLEQEGFAPVFALRDPIEARRRLGARRDPVLQAPLAMTRRLRDGKFYARSFADILGLIGYDDAERLGAMVESWRALVALVDPAIVVGDFSPTLALATAGTEVPLLQVGSGFALPPAQLDHFPIINPAGTPIATDRDLLDAARRVLAPVVHRGGLPALIAGQRQCACTWPIFDPYRARRAPAALGPLGPTPPQRPTPAIPRWFAYLAADAPNVAGVIDGLLASRHPGAAVIRQADARLAERFERAGKTLHRQLPRLVDMLADASLVIHHGGISTAETALAMGVPQLIASRHLEQHLTGRAVAATGIGRAMPVRSPAATITDAVDTLLEDRAVAARAAREAAAIGDRRGALDSVLAAALSLRRPSHRHAGAA